jgi:hypothetical protein
MRALTQIGDIGLDSVVGCRPFLAYLIDEDEESLILRFHRNEIAVPLHAGPAVRHARNGSGCAISQAIWTMRQVGSRAAADQRRLVAAARSNPDLGPNARRPVTPWSKCLAKLATPRIEHPDARVAHPRRPCKSRGLARYVEAIGGSSNGRTGVIPSSQLNQAHPFSNRTRT